LISECGGRREQLAGAGNERRNRKVSGMRQ
jgi:hypothetical protein